jgi:deoxyribose-phosphate aldolase
VSGDVEAYADEWATLVRAAGLVPVKAMLELGALPRDLWATAITRAEAGGVAWVKNSSGWGEGGKATPEIISFMKAQARRARVKASGGIRTAEDARTIMAAGAELLGSSAGPAIMKGRAGVLAY